MLSGNTRIRPKSGKVRRQSFFSQSNPQRSNGNNESVLKKRSFSETRLNNENTYCSTNNNDNNNRHDNNSNTNNKNSTVDADSTHIGNSASGNNYFDLMFENHDENNISSENGDVIDGQYSLQRVCSMKFMFF